MKFQILRKISHFFLASFLIKCSLLIDIVRHLSCNLPFFSFFLFRKKIGCSPTGLLVYTAKASGFSSVSEMLQAVDPETICKNVKDKVCSPKTPCPNKV